MSITRTGFCRTCCHFCPDVRRQIQSPDVVLTITTILCIQLDQTKPSVRRKEWTSDNYAHWVLSCLLSLLSSRKRSNLKSRHRFYNYHYTPKHHHLSIVKNRRVRTTRTGFVALVVTSVQSYSQSSARHRHQTQHQIDTF